MRRGTVVLEHKFNRSSCATSALVRLGLFLQLKRFIEAHVRLVHSLGCFISSVETCSFEPPQLNGFCQYLHSSRLLAGAPAASLYVCLSLARSLARSLSVFVLFLDVYVSKCKQREREQGIEGQRDV